MWTYRNESASGLSNQSSRFSSASAPVVTNKERVEIRQMQSPVQTKTFRLNRPGVNRNAKRSRAFFSGSVIYLFGILLGSFWQTDTGGWIQGYTQHYVRAHVSRFLEQQAGLIFCAEFLAFLMQLIFAMIAGFCAAGVLVLPCILLLKGIGTGFFISCLYLEYGIVKGAGMELLFFFTPQIFGVFLLIYQCVLAWSLSKSILALCMGNRGISLAPTAKHVLNRFLLCSAASLIPCAMSAVSSILFASLFLA